MNKRIRRPSSWVESTEFFPPEGACSLLAALRAAGGSSDWRQIDAVETRELLDLDRHTATQTYVTALAMSLTEAIGAEPKLNTPGSLHYSFDEAWLLRLVERCQAKDAGSMSFLISSRVPDRYRNAIGFLINGLVDRLENPADYAQASEC